MSATPVFNDAWLYPLPVPDVVHTTASLLPDPVPATPGRCICCRQTVTHRFLLDEDVSLRALTDALSDAAVRLDRTQTQLTALERRRQTDPRVTGEQLRAAAHACDHARLAARRLALRHVRKNDITDCSPLTPQELALFHEEGPPWALCALCHAWHALNGYAAAQGVMVWLPDLHPATVVSLNRRALRAVFSDDRQQRRTGRKILRTLMQNRLITEERFRSHRPVDFAEALRRHPPAHRERLREQMRGTALVLLPDAFPVPEHLL